MDTNQAFKLCLANMAVIYHILKRLGYKPKTPDFFDAQQTGIEIYVKYAQQYHDAVCTDAEHKRFNRLAYNYIYLTLRKLKWRQSRNTARFMSKPLQLVMDESSGIESQIHLDPEPMSQLTELQSGLTQLEWRILLYRLSHNHVSNREIAKALNVSESTISRNRQHIMKKFNELQKSRKNTKELEND